MNVILGDCSKADKVDVVIRGKVRVGQFLGELLLGERPIVGVSRKSKHIETNTINTEARFVSHFKVRSSIELEFQDIKCKLVKTIGEEEGEMIFFPLLRTLVE